VITLTVVSSPVGPLTLAAREDRLIALRFGDERDAVVASLSREERGAIAESADPAGAVAALKAYFTGDLGALDRLAVDPRGTPFQQRVWGALRSVTAGRTAAYSDIASTIGLPMAIRAVGAANGANPIAIVVPCHRIIGRSGSLVGYGGGLERKRWLLEHEGVLLKM
jgi:methylated-DNA-[protein]-cysteine S-methyltransferase